MIKNGIIQDKSIQGVPVTVDLIPKSNITSRPAYHMVPMSITVHNTGNRSKGANAKSHTNYIDTAKGYVSWHFSVDDKEIYQELPVNENAWHAGDGGEGKGNRTSIAIEICEHEGINWAKAKENAAKLINYLLYNLNLKDVYPHKHWSGKYCPRVILNEGWDKFLEFVEILRVKTPIISESTASIEQMKQWARNKKASEEFVRLADMYYTMAQKIGINPVMAYAQFAHETGYLYKIPSSAGLDASYHNPCGLKTTKGGGDYQASAHTRFKSWEDGISAHLDHIALYAGVVGYPRKDTLDPRHFSWIFGRAKYIEDLSGKWAPSKSYATKILKFMTEIQDTKVDIASKELEKARDRIKQLEEELESKDMKILNLRFLVTNMKAGMEKILEMKE